MKRALWLVPLSACVFCAFAQRPGMPSFNHSELIPSFREASARLGEFETLLEKPVDAVHTLLVVRGRIRADLQGNNQDWLSEDYLGLFLQDSANPQRVWKLAVFQNDEPGTLVKVERADGNALVLSRTGEYELRRPSLKLFFDVGAKKLVRTVKFDPVAVEQLVASNGAVYAIAKRPQYPAKMEGGQVTFEPRYAAKLKGNRATLATPGELEQVLEKTALTELPEPLRDLLNDFPQSTQADLMRARGQEVRAHTTGADIKEETGPVQEVGNRVWFGKTFYDGEGATGVGAIGYYDLRTQKFTSFSPPEIVKWSVSALLVEGDTVWAGLKRRPEGAEHSGGLLRYDLSTKRAKVFPVGEVVLNIVRAGDALYLGSSNGVYVLREGRLARYVFEPAPDGNFEIVGVDNRAGG